MNTYSFWTLKGQVSTQLNQDLTLGTLGSMLQDAEDDYSLTVNLRRLYQLQLVVNVSNNLFTDLQGLLDEYSNLGDEVLTSFLLLILDNTKCQLIFD